MMKSISAILGLSLMAACPAFAGEWTLSGEESKIAFGSIKKDTVGEVHHFKNLSGSVDNAGKVAVEIDVASVETWIDIRNERMQKMVLNASPKVMLNAQIDAKALEKMKIGETTTIDVEGSLAINGKDVPIETSLFIARLSEQKMLATSDEMVMLSMKEAGLDEGITKLMEVAKLPGITRVSPVTFRLVFNRSAEEKMAKSDATATTAAAAATVTVAAVTGDAEKGKKVFRKCKACHVVNKEKNRVGPHLKGVIGRNIASVDGFKYSDAFKASDIVWTPENLAAFLKKPSKYIKGTNMKFAGLKKDDQIADVIAYIAEESK